MGACAPTEPVLPDASPDQSFTPAFAVSMPAQCSGQTHYLFFTNCWFPGQPIQVEELEGQFVGSQQAAVDDWNQYLREDAQSPFFQLSSSPTVTVTATETGTQFCGTFSPGLDHITIMSMTGNCNPNAHHGSWAAAFKQELAGIIGWSEGVEGSTTSFFEPGLTSLCVLNLDKDAPIAERIINDQVCVHEAEGVILAYRGLANNVGFDRMFRDTVYMHVALNATTQSMAVGDTVDVAATEFFSGGFGTGGGGGEVFLLAPGGHIPVSKPTNGQVLWTSRPSGRLQHLGGGRFVATNSGTVWVAARPSAPASSQTRWWLPFAERGDSLPVVIAPPPPPPPPPPFKVTSIAADEMPFQSVGFHQLVATVVSAPGPVTTRWLIVDSRNPTVTDTVFVGGTTLTRNIGSGSYNMSFTVRPQSGSTIGFSAVQDVPVCTESSGGGGTDAVANCPPPGGVTEFE